MKRFAPGPDDAELATLLRALGNPLRLAIARYIAEHPGCICNDLVIRLERAQATISQHLAILRRANLLVAERDGHATCYWLDGQRLEWLQAQVEHLTDPQRGSETAVGEREHR
jgi:ArsR family transcriptional regulator, arsenate/arsenite/antimonite-responsive transcriptional repressor